MVQLAHLMLYLSIIDGGADTHVLGGSWIKLFTVNKNTPMADVVGFDSQAARKHNLPIGTHTTKTTDTNGREIILVATHGVGNPSSKHTLLCSYQMRELGIIVDDIHARHEKGPMGTLGTQSLIFKDGTIVDLKCKSTLMAFNTTIPTMEEVENLPKYQIAFKNWNPQRYYDELDINKITTPKTNQKSLTQRLPCSPQNNIHVQFHVSMKQLP